MLYRLLLLSCLFVTSAFAGDSKDYQLPTQYLQDVKVFLGDKHGQFKNDLVAVLGDGSQWKVHPTDQVIFGRWNLNDEVRIGLRTSFYWFKREHKFELHNLTCQEVVKVMLVKYPEDPLMIKDTQKYVAGYRLDPVTTYDSQGRAHTTYNRVDFHKKKLYLNEGPILVIDQKFDSFVINKKVYMGANVTKEGVSYFIISGLEREATHADVSVYTD